MFLNPFFVFMTFSLGLTIMDSIFYLAVFYKKVLMENNLFSIEDNLDRPEFPAFIQSSNGLFQNLYWETTDAAKF